MQWSCKEQIAKQPKKWMLNKPLHDFDPMSGVYQSTGMSPTMVWANLPAEMCMEPMPQDNSMEACFEAQGDMGCHTLTQMDIPYCWRKQSMSYLEAKHEGQCEIQDSHAQQCK